jgi:alpha-mannosidase
MDERIIRAKLDLLRSRTVKFSINVDGWQVCTADYLRPGQYLYDGDWAPLSQDQGWQAGKTLFLTAQVHIPDDFPSDDTCIDFDLEKMEGLLSVDGRPYSGIDENHRRIILPPGRGFALEAEFICVIRSLSQPEMRKEKARIREIRLLTIDRELEAVYYDLLVAWDASHQIRDARRSQLIQTALEQALLLIDMTAPDQEFLEQVRTAKKVLKQSLAVISPDPEAGKIFFVGHTHIDTAWLWTVEETIRKTARTFSTACRLMEQYPDFTFSCSQAQLYEYMRVYYPDLYEEICRWVKTGRWECTGAMWVESDCNVPTGESLIRQLLYGTAYFEEQFGVRPRTCWLPDVFGYPASLPGILKGSGVENFMTCKLHWQARNPFPNHLFWWEGLDGSRVLAHIPRLRDYYNGLPDADGMVFAWDHYHQKGVYPEVMLPFGYGDGGGGVTAGMLEATRRLTSFPGLPASRQGVEETYYTDVRQTNPDLPVWVGELYLETHRGTYTSQAKIKRENRKNELLLREAEFFGLVAKESEPNFDMSSLQDAWRNLLLLQFHDILPGSSIGQVYQEAGEDHFRIASSASDVRNRAFSALSVPAEPDHLMLFNSLSWDRTDIVVVPLPRGKEPGQELEIVDDAGNTMPLQVISKDGEPLQAAFVPGPVPAFGYSSVHVRTSETPTTSLKILANGLENQFFVLELSPEGEIIRLFDKRADRELIPQGEHANVLQLFQDGPEREAAWNIHETYTKRFYSWDAGTKITITETGPVRACVRVEKTYRESHIAQDIALYDRLPKIDFVTHCDWQERQVLLKAAFPLDIRSMVTTCEIQYGAVERATHRNTSWEQEKFEICAHRWVDLSEGDYGVSLLNDCKYGYDVQGNVLRITLLRGPEYPDPDSDRGLHEFTYSLYPHQADWRQGGTVHAAASLNQPIACLSSSAPMPGLALQQSYVEVDGPAILDWAKPAEDGRGWIVRFYEPHGGRGKVAVHLQKEMKKITACNHIEEDQEQIESTAHSFSFFIRPFEVRTFRVE